MKKVFAIIWTVIIGIVVIGLIGFCAIHIAMNGFNAGSLPVIIGCGISGLILAIKTIRRN